MNDCWPGFELRYGPKAEPTVIPACRVVELTAVPVCDENGTQLGTLHTIKVEVK